MNWKAKAGLKRSPTAQHLHCILTQYLHSFFEFTLYLRCTPNQQLYSSFEFTLYLRCTPNQHLHSSFEFTLYLRCTPKQNLHSFFEFIFDFTPLFKIVTPAFIPSPHPH